ncbi:MAG: hypothetical protein WC366_02195 [Bacilli bacterium]|jgi:hypothetical protein
MKQENNHETQKEKVIDIVTRVGISTLIIAILFFVISFLYIPTFSYNMYSIASFSGLDGVDSSLNENDLLITEKRDFTQSQGDVIVFDLKGYDDSDGMMAYRCFAVRQDHETGLPYCLVGSTDSSISYPWKVTEDMYRGTVIVRISGMGAITGFFANPLSLIFWVVAGASVAGIVIIVKHKPKEKSENEDKESKK